VCCHEFQDVSVRDASSGKFAVLEGDELRDEHFSVWQLLYAIPEFVEVLRFYLIAEIEGRNFKVNVNETYWIAVVEEVNPKEL
jgi:hypothetical protein